MESNLSVIIVNYNSGKYLAECVKSVLAIDNVSEVIVVDNASRDDSLERIEGFQDERLLSVSNDKNIGFAAACNQGLELTQHPLILFLNPDCLLEKQNLNILIDELVSDKTIGIVGPCVINPDGSEQANARRMFPRPKQSFFRAFGLSKLFPKLFKDYLLNNTPLPQEPTEVEAISGSCMLLRRDELVNLGFWDDNYFMHCEDLDLCMRYWQSGQKIVFVPDAKVLHHKGMSSQKEPVRILWNMHQGMLRFYEKFYKAEYPFLLWWLVKAGVYFRFMALALFSYVKRLRHAK